MDSSKSQIAIEYAYRIRQRDPLMSTFWVHSSSQVRFKQSFGEIAKRIRSDACEVGRSDTLQTVSKWLTDVRSGPWLIILDNADDTRVLLDLQEDSTAKDIAQAKRRLTDYIPQVPHGVVLVTTRDRTAGWAMTGDYSAPIQVESMNPLESLELLKGKLPVESGSEAVELVMELEHVPLAISQAGAYIRERAPLMSIPKYLAEFRKSQDNQTTLLNSNHADLRRDGEVPNAVTTSWQLSFDHVLENYPKAGELLCLMSFFNRQAIPQFLVQRGYDDLAFGEVIGPLLNFSLVRADNTGQMFELHRLVQIATRHWIERDGSTQKWIDCAIDRMAEEFPGAEDQRRSWAACEMLISHVEEVLGNEPGSEQFQLKYANLLIDSSLYLIERKEDFLLAEERSKKALAIQRHILAAGDDHLLLTLSFISYAYRMQKKYQEAEVLDAEVLEQRIKGWGEMNESTQIAMNNLAQSYITLRKYEKAEEMLLRVRSLQATLLGNDYLFTEIKMAALKIKQHDFQTAETLSLYVIERWTTMFGSDHADVIDARTILSEAYRGQERYVEAAKLELEVLSTCRRVFGERHRKTLSAAHTLALCYLRERKLVEAESQCRECLGFRREILGTQHQTTLCTELLLGSIFLEQNDLLAASQLFANVLDISREVHGAEHGVTMLALNKYAFCAKCLGNKQEAIRLMTELVEGQTKLYGADHFKTVNSAEWLADWKAAEDEKDASREVERGQNENAI